MNMNKFTVKQFNELFSDDDACLNYMFEQAYGNMPACHNCDIVEPKYYRVRKKKAFECKDCGYQISPLANTIFHKSLPRSATGSMSSTCSLFPKTAYQLKKSNDTQALLIKPHGVWQSRSAHSCYKATSHYLALLKPTKPTLAAAMRVAALALLISK